MSYWAPADDPHFSEGHYVEPWELERLHSASPVIRELLSQEASHGNKLVAVAERFFQLRAPLRQSVLSLPTGLAFLTPLYPQAVRVLDGDEDGVVLCLASGARVFPHGHEREPPGSPTRAAA